MCVDIPKKTAQGPRVAVRLGAHCRAAETFCSPAIGATQSGLFRGLPSPSPQGLLSTAPCPPPGAGHIPTRI